ncbi:MAG: sn-glycerol-1-phosphate dehydrogenase [Oscillospiraceae bacterium]|nr:sn-glycerol-1-phosphate dehydrogenase [Oscillospiraceae bacterium]
MDINELLKGVHDCPCGRDHSCAIRYVSVRPGAVEDLAGILDGFRHIVLTADENTYATCGRRVEEILGERMEGKLVFRPEGLLIPNEEAIEKLSAAVTGKTDLIVGIGSGVINDLCKYVSFTHDLPYYIIATAPSMDGYASVGAAMITGNMKTTFNARVPAAIIGDVDILKQAPMRMIQSGFGDIIGKYSALNDWKLAALVNGEYFCDYVYDLTYDTMVKTRDLAQGVRNREEGAIQALMEALVIVGVAMAFVGNSRPASGSEHHLSHYFEITGIVKGREYLLHGIDVAYSTIVTAGLREELRKLPRAPEHYASMERGDWEKQIRASYGYAADGVIALQDKVGWYAKDPAAMYGDKWAEICRILAEVPSAKEIRDCLATVGLDDAEFTALYGADTIQDAVWFAKDLKDRYTVLWLYFSCFYRG